MHKLTFTTHAQSPQLAHSPKYCMAESRHPNYTANSSFYHVFLDTYFEKQQQSPSFQYLQKRHISSIVSKPCRVF